MNHHELSDILLEGFKTVAKYNGYYVIFADLIQHIKNNSNQQIVRRPHNLGDPDSIQGIIWSICVSEFGMYGTSPRFGWIEDTKKCIDFLETLHNKTKPSELEEILNQ